ncbi:hypothetical protein OG21DRAFT_1498337 [Imleria badia]|nr:hypothetical protein OG21DRAFT_1498337 [Imleria badia]
MMPLKFSRSEALMKASLTGWVSAFGELPPLTLLKSKPLRRVRRLLVDSSAGKCRPAVFCVTCCIAVRVADISAVWR